MPSHAQGAGGIPDRECEKRPTVLFHDVMTDIAQLAHGDIFQPLSVAIEVLVELDRGLLHHSMRVLRPTKQDEVVATGQTLVAVLGVECQAQ